MDLNDVNHVITRTKSMLDDLVIAEAIDEPDARSLLPVLVREIVKNQALTSEYAED